MNPPPECGTIAAYSRHMRRREKACPACAEIHAAYMREYRRSIREGQPRSVSAVGVKRRIQALMAMGFNSLRIAEELGVPDNLVRHWYREAKTVYPATYQKVAGLFDRLQWTVGPSKRAAALAQRKGWAPPLAWDEDIDAPEAQPHGMRRSA